MTAIANDKLQTQRDQMGVERIVQREDSVGGGAATQVARENNAYRTPAEGAAMKSLYETLHPTMPGGSLAPTSTPGSATTTTQPPAQTPPTSSLKPGQPTALATPGTVQNRAAAQAWADQVNKAQPNANMRPVLTADGWKIAAGNEAPTGPTFTQTPQGGILRDGQAFTPTGNNTPSSSGANITGADRMTSQGRSVLAQNLGNAIADLRTSQGQAAAKYAMAKTPQEKAAADYDPLKVNTEAFSSLRKRNAAENQARADRDAKLAESKQREQAAKDQASGTDMDSVLLRRAQRPGQEGQSALRLLQERREGRMTDAQIEESRNRGIRDVAQAEYLGRKGTTSGQNQAFKGEDGYYYRRNANNEPIPMSEHYQKMMQSKESQAAWSGKLQKMATDKGQTIEIDGFDPSYSTTGPVMKTHLIGQPTLDEDATKIIVRDDRGDPREVSVAQVKKVNKAAALAKQKPKYEPLMDDEIAMIAGTGQPAQPQAAVSAGQQQAAQPGKITPEQARAELARRKAAASAKGQ